MLNKVLITQPIGPNGEFGSVTVAFVNGQLQASVNLSPKAALAAAAKDVGGVVAPEVATFLDNAIGLA
jgi:hypothetical protein